MITGQHLLLFVTAVTVGNVRNALKWVDNEVVTFDSFMWSSSFYQISAVRWQTLAVRILLYDQLVKEYRVMFNV